MCTVLEARIVYIVYKNVLYLFLLQFHMLRLEQLCVQYLEASIGHKNVLVALQNAARLKLDVLKVQKYCLFCGLSMPFNIFNHIGTESLLPTY